MEILTRYELELNRREFINRIKKGAVFIHPTDTIYGLGCNALDEKAVKKIRKIKGSGPNKHYSIWVPSLDWIKKNCQSSKELDKWLKELPGQYTLIIKTNKNIFSIEVTPNKTIGIRHPDHWMKDIIKELGLPIITTSANKTGEHFMTSIEDLNPEIKRELDFIIYEGNKKARPSKIVNLIEGEEINSR